jgi:hypothetical protein
MFVIVPTSNGGKNGIQLCGQESILQMKYPENDYSYPIPKEVSDLWDAPSGGGSHWMYSGFEDYYFRRTHPHWSWVTGDIPEGNLVLRTRRRSPTREEAWKEWITTMIGK